MKTTAQILITYARTYDIDGGTKGTSVNYFFLDDQGQLLVDTKDGQQNAKVSLSFDSREKMLHIPGIYDGSFEMTVGSDRKPLLKLVDIAYKSDIVFQNITDSIKSVK